MKKIIILTTNGELEFVGKYLPDRQVKNRHYYETNKGEIIHIRKEHMIYVTESN